MASPAILTSLSAFTIAVGGSVTDSATLTGAFQASGTVTYNLFNNNACSGAAVVISTVTVSNGAAPSSASHTFAVAGSFSWNAVYSGDANNSPATSSCESLTVTATGNPVLLTFKGFNLDDFDNGVGQFQVLVNGHLVADIPAGLNHLTGSGDYAPYQNTWVGFGPFDITGFVVQGQNTIMFRDPLSDHEGLVKNVTITQGNVVLLHVRGAREVEPGSSVTYTFSIPPLVLTSFTASNSRPAVGQDVTLTATYTGGTAPFKCIFQFGDGSYSVVNGVSGSCTATHSYQVSGIFTAKVIVIGSSTSDRATARLTITVT
jgi:hypothetical protein